MMKQMDSMSLRKASINDAKLLYEWRNDETTIKNSRSRSGVAAEEHMDWLKRVIENPARKLYILEINGIAVGQLRLDLLEKEDASAEISYGVGKEYRGQGLGKILILQAEILAQMLGLRELVAEVLPHNGISAGIFRKQGFVEEIKEDIYVYTKQYK